MTALSSTGNFSRFGTYFLYKLRGLRSLIIMNGIFALLSYPLAFTAFSLYINVYNEQYAMRLDGLIDTPQYDEVSRRVTAMNDFFIVAVIIGVIMLMAMFLMSYIIPAKSFRWLHRKTVVDMDYSLPVSDDTRFFGDLLAGLAGSLVPHGLAAAIGYLLLDAALSGFIRVDEDILAYDAVRVAIFQGMLTGLFACVMFTALSLLIMSVCGRTAESRIYPFVLNAAIPIVHIVCLYIVLGNVRGYEMGISDSTMDSAAASSPLGLLGVTLPNFLNGTLSHIESNLPLFRAEIFIPALIVVLACLAGAYFLIKFRRAERVGQPFVYRAVKLLIPALVTFAVVAPFASTVLPEMFGDGDPEYSYSPPVGSLIFAMVIATFVLYVIMELISGRGFRKFYITLGKYAATLAGCMLICLGLYFSEGFGIGRAVPAADDVAQVHFDFNSYEDDEDFYSDVYEKANIQAVTDMHRAIIDSPEEPSLFNIDISYRMNNGTYLARQYRVSEELYSKYIREIITPEAYYRTFRGYLDVLSGATIVEIDTLALNGKIAVDIPGETFCQALLRDCEKVSYEKLFGDSGEAIPSRVIRITTYDPEHVSMYSSQMGYTITFEVPGWHENVIALLEQNGVALGFTPSDYATAILCKGTKSGENSFMLTQNVLAAFYKSGDSSLSLEEYEHHGVYLPVYPLDENGDIDVERILAEDIDLKSTEGRTPVEEYGVVMIPIDDPMTKQLFDGSSFSTAEGLGYSDHAEDGEDCYILCLTRSRNAAEYISDYSELYLYISADHYDEAEKMFDEYNVLVPMA